MQKKPTRRRISRPVKQCVAIFFTCTALWLIWLTADPTLLIGQVTEAINDDRVAMSLISAELGTAGGDFSLLDRLVISQSPLFSGTVSAPLLTPPVTGHTTPAPEPVQSDEPPLPTTTTAPDGIVSKTMVAGSSSKYVTEGKISIYNHTDYTLDIPALLSAAPDLTAPVDGPRVLIFHSHATEAYTMDGTDIYEESDDYRTLDIEHNVVRVGTEMAAILESAGIQVIHDTTLYDYPSYTNAYVLSSEGVDRWLKQYPTIQVVIDVHRDALTAADGTIYKTAAGTVDQCAQVMMVMGSDAMGQKHPNWRVNLSFAVAIQKALTDKWATLARPIVLRTSRFNQHQSTGEILVEVGTHGNTLQEAITAGRLFARTLAELMT